VAGQHLRNPTSVPDYGSHHRSTLPKSQIGANSATPNCMQLETILRNTGNLQPARLVLLRLDRRDRTSWVSGAVLTRFVTRHAFRHAAKRK
jgi:hypothetical protein